MKTLAKLGMVVALAGSLYMSGCAGSYYVSAQPVEPVYERPAVPYAGAVWIDGEYTWSGGTYVYVRGHWDRPRNGRGWVRGGWERGQRGWRWRRGHWR